MDESALAELNQLTLKSKLYFLKESDLKNAASRILLNLLGDFKKYFKQLDENKLLSIEESDGNTVFCTSECPTEMQYSTSDLYCTDKPE
jgi:hypothetical protein